jgi:plasmid stabilization system protein ParE
MVVIWELEARNDLREIFNYYVAVAGYQTAMKITGRIREYADALGIMPYSAPIERYLEDMPGQHRSRVVKRNHKIIYRVVDDVVYVIAIFDCRRDPVRLRDIFKR